MLFSRRSLSLPMGETYHTGDAIEDEDDILRVMMAEQGVLCCHGNGEAFFEDEYAREVEYDE